MAVKQPSIDVQKQIQSGPVTWLVTNGHELDLEAITAWMTKVSPVIDELLDKKGALLIRGLVALQSAVAFERVVREVTPVLRDYVGGTSPREVVAGRVMTATAVPDTWSIILHQEMAYTRDPPARIGFFCLEPSADEGGSSTLGDMRSILKHIDPSVRDRLERDGLQLRRVLPSPSTLHLKPGVRKPWPEVLGTEDRIEAERIATSKGWRAEWLQGETLCLWQDVVPATRAHPVTGELVWMNQAHFHAPVCMMKWAEEDGRRGDYAALAAARENNSDLLDNIYLGSGEPVAESDALHVYDALRSIERPLRLQRSDILLLDNFLFAHGRRAFPGRRKLLVTIADRATARNGDSDVSAGGGT